MDEKLRNLKPESIEVDECWTLVANKRAKGNTPDTGGFYAYLASGRDSKLIAAYATGKRDYSSSDILISDLRTRVADRFQITSDDWQGFIRGVLDNNHGDKMDYAFHVKKFDNYIFIPESDKRRYSPVGRCVSVKTHRACGSPDGSMISTSHAERLNLTQRHFNKRFTRLSPCFSKKANNLRALCCTHSGVFQPLQPARQSENQGDGNRKGH